MRFKKKILKRLIISSLIMIICVVLPIVTLNILYTKKNIIKTYESNLLEIINILEPVVNEKIEIGDLKGIDNYIKSLKLEKGYRITIINVDGKVIADSMLEPENMENLRTRPEVIEAIEGRIGKSIRYSPSIKEDMLYVAKTSTSYRYGLITVIRVSFSLKELDNIFYDILYKTILISIFVIILGIIITLYFSRYLINSIKEINSFLKSLIDKNFKKRFIAKSNDEIGEIFDNLNSLSLELEKSSFEYLKESEKLNTVISTIEEGIVLINSDGLISISNDTFKKIIDEEEVSKKFYWEVIKNIEIIEFIKKTINEKVNMINEFILSNKTFLIKSFYLKKFDEFLFTFLDISNIRKIQEVKRDFVRDASHELKTPLTAIKGFIETLEEEPTNKKYIEIIKRNVDRMINIINDLIMLSKLEDKETKLEITEFDFKEMIESIVKIFSNQIKEKNLKFTLEIDDKDKKIKGDLFKLEQVFINLIDNSIKYSEKGEIRVKLYKKEGKVFIEVSDTGIGIPKESLDRIFDRFYVVNKSRSKSLGGTGLGLSIVKHIVLLHGGKIEVSSELGKGTKFIIILPDSIS